MQRYVNFVKKQNNYLNFLTHVKYSTLYQSFNEDK